MTEGSAVIGTSWTHRLVRIAVRPLVGTPVTPNHLTMLRLVTRLLACAALLPGETSWNWWAGWLWLLSAFLDRADGELARIVELPHQEVGYMLAAVALDPEHVEHRCNQAGSIYVHTCLTFAPSRATMSQKPSLRKASQTVSQLLTAKICANCDFPAKEAC
jgi:hypothetical protein